MDETRRGFLGRLVAAVPLLVARPGRAATVDRRVLGRTGAEVSILGLGLGSFFTDAYSANRQAAREVLEHALELGVNYFDTANAYGASQSIIAPVVKAHRSRIFLSSKSADRGYHGFRNQLEQSLRTLGTDHLDMFHIHALAPGADLGSIERGAVKAAREAKQAGKIKAFGVTGHRGASILIQAIKAFDPDAVMTVLSAERRDEGRYEDELLPLARERKMGILAMKTVAFGWRTGHKIPELIRYALSLDGVAAAVIGLESQFQLDQNAAVATGFEPLPKGERSALNRAMGQALAGQVPPWEREGYEDGRGLPA